MRKQGGAKLERVGAYANLMVRQEDLGDTSAVHAVNEAAFERQDEADLVDSLRSAGVVLLSLVAEVEQQIVGHILFSRMWIDGDGEAVPAAALAPVAVLPGHQRRGIGERLIRTGLDYLSKQQERIVIVLGHPEYYSRFGFSSEQARSLESPFPPEAFMALELVPDALSGIRGRFDTPLRSASDCISDSGFCCFPIGGVRFFCWLTRGVHEAEKRCAAGDFGVDGFEDAGGVGAGAWVRDCAAD